jgi:hypothetical protein
VAAEEPQVEESAVVQETAVAVPPFYRAGPKTAEEVNYQIEEQPEPATPSYYKIVIIVLFLLCLAFGLYMLKPEWFRRNNHAVIEPTPTTVPVVETPAVVLPDTLDTAAATLKRDGMLVDSAEVTVAPVINNPVATKAAVVEPVKAKVISYEVIASSVYGEKAAQQFIASMKRKWGINAKIVSQLPGKKIKISVASFKDEKKARAERTRLEEKLSIPGLYIYTNTNKPE